MKKWLCLLLSVLLTAVLVGCSSSGSKSPSPQATGTTPAVPQAPAKEVKLTFMTNVGGKVFEAYQAIFADFMKENPNIKIDASSQGKDFESLMKAKMASNDFPDLWTTHGWSVERYSKYLLPLNDQPWYSKVKKQIMPIISNSKGEIFVLPLDIDQGGIVVNKTVLEKSGVHIDSLNTWNDFVAAFEKIKTSGFTPIGMWGKDPRNFSQFLDEMATPLYISSPTHAYGDKLKDGNFDWSEWKTISQMLIDLKQEGYLNKDVLTATEDSVQQAMAKDQIAFLINTNSSVSPILQFNPNVKIGFMPLPAYYSDDKRQLVGGERDAVGIWKDTKYKAEAQKLLSFMAKDENVKKIAEAQGMAAALEGVKVDLGVLTADFEKYKEVPLYNYFDRIYLPSGMWSIMQQVGAALVSGQTSSEDAAKVMKTNYDRLRNQQTQ